VKGTEGVTGATPDIITAVIITTTVTTPIIAIIINTDIITTITAAKPSLPH
jgi:hypothetical protein